MFNHKTPLNFIRFGLQRKKTFLKDVKQAYEGLVIPANILLYQYKSTPILIHMCKPKYFFVDPMSYLFGQSYEDFRKKDVFKPSFSRLMEYHGLPVKTFARYDHTKLLTYLDSGKKNLKEFVTKTLEFQKQTILNNLTTYAKDLIESTDFNEKAYMPSFLVPPYFLYEKDKKTTELNYKILEFAASLGEEIPVFPMVFIKKEDLTSEFWKEVQRIISNLKFKGYCLWIDNFREFGARKDEIQQIVYFIRALSQDRSLPVIMMYGGYFSLLLYYYGLTGICHGTSFSESRGVMDSVRQSSGPAPIRYYIRELHQFFPLDSASLILESDPSLICNCQVCQRVVKGVPENVTNYNKQEPLAEMHFLLNRWDEKREIGSKDPATLAKELNSTYSKLDLSRVTKTYKLPWGKEERSIVDTRYIANWSSVLTSEPLINKLE